MTKFGSHPKKTECLFGQTDSASKSESKSMFGSNQTDSGAALGTAAAGSFFAPPKVDKTKP